MKIYLDKKRLKRFWRLMKSRWQSYEGLCGADSIQGTVDWVVQNGLLGFNGNSLRARIVKGLAQAYNATVMVETGTYHAATTLCARRLLGIPVLTCELSRANWIISKCLTFGMNGIQVYCAHSAEFLQWFVQERGGNQRPLFYLDAHEGDNPNSLPLLEELQMIFKLNSFVIIIDDFQVPFDPYYAFGTYNNISLNLALLRDLLAAAFIGKCYFPNYPASIETGYRSGYVVIWRSSLMDELYKSISFPLSLLKEYSLYGEPARV